MQLPVVNLRRLSFKAMIYILKTELMIRSRRVTWIQTVNESDTVCMKEVFWTVRGQVGQVVTQLSIPYEQRHVTIMAST